MNAPTVTWLRILEALSDDMDRYASDNHADVSARRHLDRLIDAIDEWVNE